MEMNKFDRNKFYIGSNSVFDRNWGHKTLDGALTHARGIITLEGKHDEVFIVKIIKVVRKKQAPVEIVDVR